MSIPDELFLNKNLPVLTWNKKLPHWSQKGKAQFITLHLADSLPQNVLKEICDRKKTFLATYPKPWSKEINFAYSKTVTTYLEKYLDAGMGVCLFSNPNFRSIVSEALHFMNGVEYALMAYVIMPNHLHLLAIEFEEKSLEKNLSQIKKYTSRKINAITGNKGSIWMRECYDRIIRNEEHYLNCVQYIKNNPVFLSPGEYELGGWEFESDNR